MVSSRSIRAGAAYVELSVNNSKLLAGLKSAQAKLKAFSAGVRDVGAGLLKASSLAAAPLALSAKTFGSFRDQMAIVQAVTNATEQDFSKLTDRAKELGRTTSFTASEVASAMVALGRAGVSTDEILASIAVTLDLARAGAIDLGEATTIMADVSRSFGLTADEAGRVGDVLAKTANTDVKLVGESMKYVASSANLSGQSLERMSAALAVLANRGLKGEMAGASMAMALSQLSGDDVQKELAGMGVAVTDAEGNMRDLIDILRDLGKATANMGNAKKLSTFKGLFDQRGMRSMILLSQNVDEWQKLTGVVTKSSGTAAAVAKKMDDTLGGSFRMLMSAVEGMEIAIGEALDGTLRAWMGRITEVAGRITALVESNKGFIISALKIIAVVGVVGAGLLVVGSAGSALAFVMGSVASIITGTVSAIGLLVGALATILSPLGVMIAAVGTLGASILIYMEVGAKALAWLGEAFDTLKNDATASFDAIGSALAAGDITLAAQVLWAALKMEFVRGIKFISDLWSDVTYAASIAWDGIYYAAADAWNWIQKTAVDAMNAVYGAVLTGGNAIAQVFWKAIEKMVDAFVWLGRKISIAAYEFHMDGLSDDIDAALKKLNDGVKGFTGKQKINAELVYGDLTKDSEALGQGNRDAYEQEKSRIAAEREQSANASTNAYLERLRQSEQELATARAEWQKVTDRSLKTEKVMIPSPPP